MFERRKETETSDAQNKVESATCIFIFSTHQSRLNALVRCSDSARSSPFAVSAFQIRHMSSLGYSQSDRRVNGNIRCNLSCVIFGPVLFIVWQWQCAIQRRPYHDVSKLIASHDDFRKQRPSSSFDKVFLFQI